MTREQLIYRAIAYFNYEFPKELTSGILFFRGEKIYIKEFVDAVKLFKG
jgi:hypothetical protein